MVIKNFFEGNVFDHLTVFYIHPESSGFSQWEQNTTKITQQKLLWVSARKQEKGTNLKFTCPDPSLIIHL